MSTATARAVRVGVGGACPWSWSVSSPVRRRPTQRCGPSSPAAGATVTELSRIDLWFTEASSRPGATSGSRTPPATSSWPARRTSTATPASLTVPVPPLGAGDYEVTWHVLVRGRGPGQGSFGSRRAPAAAARDDPRRSGRGLPAGHVAGDPPTPSPGSLLRRQGRSRPRPRGPHEGPRPWRAGRLAGDARRRARRSSSWCGPRAPRSCGPARCCVGSGRRRRHRVARAHRLPARRASPDPAPSQRSPPAAARRRARVPLRSHRRRAPRLAGGDAAPRGTGREEPTWPAPLGAVERSRRDLARAVALGDDGAARPVGSLALSLAGVARLTHVIGISAWMGGLVMLLAVVLPRRRRSELLAVLPRFSAFATAPIGVLVVGGCHPGHRPRRQRRRPDRPGYGRVLLAKLDGRRLCSWSPRP